MSQHGRILIVDDNVNLGRMMSLILLQKGYDVTVVGDGKTAVSNCEEEQFDIIFMDIIMPEMNGVQAYKIIKDSQPQAKVIMMTAFSAAELAQEALNEGAQALLHKPLDLDRVCNMIERLMDKQEQACILVVDDDEGTCITLKNILTKKGYIVGTASGGKEAVFKAGQVDFDILIVDIKMPELNGLETFLEIKQISPETTAIMITGFHQEASELIEEALKQEAYACLYKPLNIDKLLTLIERIQTNNNPWVNPAPT